MRITRSPRDVQTIVERQVRKWGLEREPRPELEPDVPWPLVTISREFGTQGAEMGRLVAQQLGFSYWDQELVEAIAEETGAQKTLVASLDETARSRLDDFLTEAVGGVSGILEPEEMLRVRVIAPEGRRVAGVAERQGITSKEADRVVRRVERERLSFIRRHYGVEVGDARHYDLVVNTGFFSLEAAAAVVVAAYKGKFGRLPEAPAGS